MTKLGPLTLMRRLGAGAMSEVHAAFDARANRLVAVKLAHPGHEDRLLHEARVLRSIAHPGVVAVQDCGTTDGRTWMSMTLLEGPTLREQSALPLRNPYQVATNVASVAAALDAVHRAGFLHRDIKPDNVLTTGEGRVCLVDFGLAIPKVHARREPVEVAGTPLYMAPELLDGAAASHASDQFALGVALYELLCGHRPFEAPTITALRFAMRRGAPMGPLHAVPRKLATIVDRMLAADPRDRFQSLGHVWRALRRWQQPTPRLADLARAWFAPPRLLTPAPSA